MRYEPDLLRVQYDCQVHKAFALLHMEVVSKGTVALKVESKSKFHFLPRR